MGPVALARTSHFDRLTHGYVEVDGYLVGVPDLRQDELSVPPQATTFFCSKGAAKRRVPPEAQFVALHEASCPTVALCESGGGDSVLPGYGLCGFPDHFMPIDTAYPPWVLDVIRDLSSASNAHGFLSILKCLPTAQLPCSAAALHDL